MGAQPSKEPSQSLGANLSLTASEIQLLKTDWPIIALLGQSGTGRSTFINLIAQEKQEVGEEVDSCTDRVTLVEARINGQPVVIVDGPGIDDTRPGVTESDILAILASCLEFTGRQKKWITGVLYLYRITDTRFGPTAKRISAMLKKLCGDDNMSRIMFCTTMWDLPTSDDSNRRHTQLCAAPALNVMISRGARTATHSSRWSNARENAEKILSALIKDLKPGPLAIQTEMIEHGKTVEETNAGQVLTSHLREEKAKENKEIARLRRQMNRADRAKLAELEAELANRLQRVEELERQRKQLGPTNRGSGCIIC